MLRKQSKFLISRNNKIAESIEVEGFCILCVSVGLFMRNTYKIEKMPAKDC